MRIDRFLYDGGKYPSRNKAREAVERGDVLVNGKVVKKPSFEVDGTEKIEFVATKDVFVSNGGDKLEKAICDFSLDVSGMTFADIGASTGGFTDCLLRRGAAKVFAVDVGESQLSKELSSDPRVVVSDGINARFMTEKTLGEKVDGVSCDISFISLLYVLKPIYDILKDGGAAITLIKPQFECGKSALGKSGIVKDKKVISDAVGKIIRFGTSVGLTPCAFTNAPIKDGKNVEFLVLWTKGERENFSPIEDLNKIFKIIMSI